jgi:chromosome segregation ATPase
MMQQDTSHISGLTDREMLLLLADQMRRMEQSVDRLMTMMEQRLTQGDRKFSDIDTRLTAHDARHTATNTAINSLDGRIMDLTRAIADERESRREQANATVAKVDKLGLVQETQADELTLWKTRVQVVGWVLGSVWAFVTFVWPFLPTLIQLVDGKLP